MAARTFANMAAPFTRFLSKEMLQPSRCMNIGDVVNNLQVLTEHCRCLKNPSAFVNARKELAGKIAVLIQALRTPMHAWTAMSDAVQISRKYIDEKKEIFWALNPQEQRNLKDLERCLAYHPVKDFRIHLVRIFQHYLRQFQQCSIYLKSAKKAEFRTLVQDTFASRTKAAEKLLHYFEPIWNYNRTRKASFDEIGRYMRLCRFVCLLYISDPKNTVHLVCLQPTNQQRHRSAGPLFKSNQVHSILVTDYSFPKLTMCICA